MNPFNYSLAEVSKALVAFIFLVGYCLLFFTTFDPGLIPAIVGVIPAAFMVIGVFAAKNHSIDDLQKTLEALKAAVLTVVVYFTQVPASTENKIGMAIGALVAVVAVYWKQNSAVRQ